MIDKKYFIGESKLHSNFRTIYELFVLAKYLRFLINFAILKLFHQVISGSNLAYLWLRPHKCFHENSSISVIFYCVKDDLLYRADNLNAERGIVGSFSGRRVIFEYNQNCLVSQENSRRLDSFLYIVYFSCTDIIVYSI